MIQMMLQSREIMRKFLPFFFKMIYRLQLLAELGNGTGKTPLTINILGVAKKE
jgi:hypothetical protein